MWSFALTQSCGTWLGLGIQLGFCFYLYQQMSQSIKTFNLEGNQTRPAKWRSGCLLTFATVLLFIVATVLFILIFTSVGKSK